MKKYLFFVFLFFGVVLITVCFMCLSQDKSNLRNLSLLKNKSTVAKNKSSEKNISSYELSMEKKIWEQTVKNTKEILVKTQTKPFPVNENTSDNSIFFIKDIKMFSLPKEDNYFLEKIKKKILKFAKNLLNY